MGKNKTRPKGWNCKKQEDGSQSCKRFEVNEEGKKIGTGSEVNVGVDDNCNPVFTGDVNQIMDEDAEAIEEVSKKVTSSCRKKKGL